MRSLPLALLLVAACTSPPQPSSAPPVVVASAPVASTPSEPAPAEPQFVRVSGETELYSRPRTDASQGPIEPAEGDAPEIHVLLLLHREVEGFAEVSPVNREACGGSSVWWAGGIDLSFYVAAAVAQPAEDECWEPSLPAPASPDAAPAPPEESTGLHLREATMHVPPGRPVFFADGTRTGRTTRPQPIIGEYEEMGELLCDALGDHAKLCYRIADIVEEPVPR